MRAREVRLSDRQEGVVAELLEFLHYVSAIGGLMVLYAVLGAMLHDEGVSVLGVGALTSGLAVAVYAACRIRKALKRR